MEKIKEILPEIVKDIRHAIVKQDFNRFKGLKIDPSMSDDPAHQQHLNDVHNGANTQNPHFMVEGNNGENARC